MNDQPRRQIGPHQGREAELLLKGEKPVALFSAPCLNHQPDQIQRLEQAVEHGLLCKAFMSSAIADRTFYCLPQAQMQMRELMAIYQRLDSQTPPDATEMTISLEDHRRIGTLLGYAPEDIEVFLEQERLRAQARQAQQVHPVMR